MNLLIFGATGDTGCELVKQALTQGYTVTAFVRNSYVQDKNLKTH
jgi:uncharacterized protein YbjT (DUF2867 family)